MTRLRSATAAAVAASVLAPAAAHAHLVSTRFGDFYGGALHPLTALEHALPMLALGLLAGLQEPRVARWLLLAAPAGLLVGLVLASVLPPIAEVSLISRGSFVLIGLLVAFGTRLSAAVLVLIAAIFGVTHGYENGLLLDPGVNKSLFDLGVATAGLVAWALIAAATVTLVRQAGWVRIAVRAAGSWVAAIGLMVMAVS